MIFCLLVVFWWALFRFLLLCGVRCCGVLAKIRYVCFHFYHGVEMRVDICGCSWSVCSMCMMCAWWPMQCPMMPDWLVDWFGSLIRLTLASSAMKCEKGKKTIGINWRDTHNVFYSYIGNCKPSIIYYLTINQVTCSCQWPKCTFSHCQFGTLKECPLPNSIASSILWTFICLVLRKTVSVNALHNHNQLYRTYIYIQCKHRWPGSLVCHRSNMPCIF